MVVLRLMRAGAKKRPFYRVVAADSRRQRDGRFLEILGHYNPIEKPHRLVLHKDKVEKWLAVGAQPSVQVASLIRSAGIPVVRAKTTNAAAAPGARKKTAKVKTAAKAKTAATKPRKPTARKTRAKAVRSKKKSASKA